MFSQLSCHSQTATFLPGNKELEPKKHCVFGVNVHFLTLPQSSPVPSASFQLPKCSCPTPTCMHIYKPWLPAKKGSANCGLRGTGLEVSVWAGASEFLPHTQQTGLPKPHSTSLGLPLTSPHCVDVWRGCSTDLKAQRLWTVGDFDNPAPNRSCHKVQQCLSRKKAQGATRGAPASQAFGKSSPRQQRHQAFQMHRETSLNQTAQSRAFDSSEPASPPSESPPMHPPNPSLSFSG